jgi:hypothetical protein
MPDPHKLLTTLRRATELLRGTRGREGSQVVLSDAEDVLVVGDLHGNVSAFAGFLKLAALDRHPQRHLVLQELIHDPKANPDQEIPDLSHRLVDLAAALKCQYPDRVHVILGNHELSELSGRSIAKGGFPLTDLFRKGVEKSYGALGPLVFHAYLELFRAMPLAVRTRNRVFIVHTIPDEQYLETMDLGPLTTGAWPPEAFERRGTVYALVWGRDGSQETADRFAAMVDADLFVIGHHACETGFQRLNDRTLVLDATDPHPCGCLFSAVQPMTIEGLLEGVRKLPASR